jgi:methylthioribose-1-phosphate isomerase
MNIQGRVYRTVWWEHDAVCMLNQHALPFAVEILRLHTHEDIAAAICCMQVRGAPAIGAAAAFGLARAAQMAPAADFDNCIAAADKCLRATRPTAQDLFHALDRVRQAIAAAPDLPAARIAALTAAQQFADENVAACRAIGEHGAALLRDGMTVLTHCNAGWLACVDWGTALAPLYVAARRGVRFRVLVDETRPRWQGARLTAWELQQEGIAAEIIVDNAAGHFLRTGAVDLCIVGADRVAANGDIANKIGTYEKAVVARESNIPFYVAAPASTFDTACASGEAIPIEERDEDEVLCVDGQLPNGTRATVRIAAPGVHARNPAFDVTPARYITGYITEHGIGPSPQ